MTDIKTNLSKHIPDLIVLALMLIAIMLLTVLNGQGNQEFVDEFNSLVPEHLQCETRKEITDMSGYPYLNAEQHAFLWNFKDRYDLTELPKTNPNDNHSGHKNYKALVELDEYINQEIKSGNMTEKQASDEIRRAIAISNADFVTIVKLNKD